MRRTDEAFKTEVLRRYGVQKRNRRNYFLLALSPLVLAVILGSLIFLPHLSGLFELTPPANPSSKVDDTPTLADIGALDVAKIEFSLPGEKSSHTVTDTKIIQTLTERMAKIETKITSKPQTAVRTPISAFISCDEYETLTIYLGQDHDYFRIDAQLKGAKETVTTWYQFFNFDRSILRKAFYTAAGVTLANSDHLDAILTSPIVQFSSKASGTVTDPTHIADLTEILFSLQLEPFSCSCMDHVIAEQLKLTLQSGKTVTFAFLGGHVSVSYQTEDFHREQQIFRFGNFETFQKLLESYKEPQTDEKPLPQSNPLAQYIDRPIRTIDFAHLVEPLQLYSCNRSAEFDSILKEIGKLSLTSSHTAIPEENYDTVIQLCFTDATFIYLYLDYDGYIAAYFYTIPGDLSVQQIFYYTVAEAGLKTLGLHLNFIMDGGLAEGSQHLRFENFLASAQPDEITVSLATGETHSYLAPDPAIGTLLKSLQALNKTPIRYPDDHFNRANRITIKQGDETLNVAYTDSRLSICFADSVPSSVDYLVGSDEMYYFVKFVRLLAEGENPPATEPVDPPTPPDPPKPPEPADLPTTLEECLKHTIKKVYVTIGVVGKTPTYTYTDQESNNALLSLIAEQELILSASQDFPDYPDGLHLQYWINDQGKEMSYFTILFDSSGKFECSVYDGKTYHKTVYDLPVDTIAAITEAAKPYYDPPPSDQTPLIKDLSDNAVLQGFLAAVGVTVHETPQDVPQEIKTLLTDYSSYALPNRGLFACDQAYTSPDEISLYSLLYNYHNGHRLTDEERTALVQAGVHPDVVENLDYGIFTEEEVQKLLADYLAYMPAFADDLHGALLEAGFVYLPETDRFYFFHGDTNETGPAENIRVYHTDRANTVIAVYSYYTSPTALAVVAFRNTADGYKVLGYTPLDPL